MKRVGWCRGAGGKGGVGTEMQRCRGAEVQRCRGAEVQRFRGCCWCSDADVEQRCNRSVEVWICAAAGRSTEVQGVHRGSGADVMTRMRC